MKKRLFIPMAVMAMTVTFNLSSAFASQMGQVNANVLNVRMENNSDSPVISKLYSGQDIEVFESKDGWDKIRLDNGKYGWVSSEYITKGVTSKGYICGNSVNLRQGESTESPVVGSLYEGTQVNIISKNADWYNVEVGGTTGYVYSDFVSLEAPTQIKPTTRSESRLISIHDVAYAQLGKKYVWGAEGPNSFDCSGFTTYVYKNATGVTLPHNSVQQSKEGAYIPKSQLTLGDLVFFDTDGGGSINHVGIYLQDGDFIHASSAKKQVMISSLNEGFYKTSYVTGRRILG